MNVMRAERPHHALRHRPYRYPGPAPGDDALIERAPHHAERAVRFAVVVEPGRVPGQPADQPDLVTAIHVNLLVPASLRVDPDAAHPLTRPAGELSHLAGQVLLAEHPRLPEHCGILGLLSLMRLNCWLHTSEHATSSLQNQWELTD